MLHLLPRMVLVLSLAPGLLPAQKAGLQPIQALGLERVLSVHPSPDGTRIAFVRLVPRMGDEPPGPHHRHLYLVEGTAAGSRKRLLVGGGRRVRHVSWKPDGSAVCFVAELQEDEHPQVYALPMGGGMPRKVTSAGHGVRDFAWGPDGRRLAYTSEDPTPPGRRKNREMGFRMKVLDETWNHVSLWLLDTRTDEATRLTEGATVSDFCWSPTGTHLAAAMAPRNLIDDYYMARRLYLVYPGDGGAEKLADNPGKLGRFAWSPGGETLAFLGAADRNDPHAGMLFTVDRETLEVKSHFPGFRGMFHDLAWESEQSLLAAVSRGVRTSLVRVQPAGEKMEEVVGGGGVAFTSIARSREGGLVVAPGSHATHPGEVFRLLPGGLDRLTDSNPSLKDVLLGRQEVVEVKARDGMRIQGLLMYPVNHDPEKLHPLVIVVHGGPESHFTEGWNTSYSRWGQMLCARGYFAWYPNYRASTGYGVAFAKANHGDPMGGEFTDHLDAIAQLAERGLIDTGRVGIGGGSYGGYAAAWGATRHTEHFAAAVSFVPFVDIRTKWLSSDIPMEFFRVHYEETWPYKQKEFLAGRSPLTYADQCRTPLLLAGGTADTRVHPAQPHMLYRAVKSYTDTPVRYVQYPGEGHGNRSNTYRYDYCLRSLRWFDHYLKPGDHRADPPPPLDLDYGAWDGGEDGE